MEEQVYIYMNGTIVSDTRVLPLKLERDKSNNVLYLTNNGEKVRRIERAESSNVQTLVSIVREYLW